MPRSWDASTVEVFSYELNGNGDKGSYNLVAEGSGPQYLNEGDAPLDSYTMKVSSFGNTFKTPATLNQYIGGLSAFTLEGYFKMTSSGGNVWVVVADSGIFVNNLIGVFFRNDNGQGYFYYNNSTWASFTSPSAGWHRFNMEFTGTAANLWIDGVLQYTYTTAVNVFSVMYLGGYNLRLGCGQTYGDMYQPNARFDRTIFSSIARGGAETMPLTPPVPTSCTPDSGNITGGKSVVIAGTNFVSGATVTFGGSSATGVTWVSATEIDCITPAHAAGVVNVVVTNPDTQTGTITGGYTYVDYTPTVVTVSPSSGNKIGGDSITITGTNFINIDSVSFGGTLASGIVVVNTTTLTCTSPTHAIGLVSVSVTNTDSQTGTKTNAYTYNNAAITQDTLVYDAAHKYSILLKRKRQNAGSFAGKSKPDAIFDECSSAALAYNYDIYAVDDGYHYVYDFYPDGSKRGSYYTGFDGNTSFIQPYGDCFYTCAESTSRVEFYTHTAGVTVVSLGASIAASGSGSTQVTAPKKIVFDVNGYMYIADSGNNRFKKYKRGTSFTTYTGSQYTPNFMCAGSAGDIYATAGTYGGVQHYSPSLTFLSDVSPTSGWTSWPCIDETEGYLYFVALGGNPASGPVPSQVWKLKISDNTKTLVISTMLIITYMALDDNYLYFQAGGRNYITTKSGHAVYFNGISLGPAYPQNYPFVNSNSSVCFGLGNFNNRGYSIDAGGAHIYCSDKTSGTLLQTITATGIQKFDFCACDLEGFLYVTDSTNKVVYIFNQNGAYCYSISSSSAVAGVTYAPGTESVVLANMNGNKIQGLIHGTFVANYGSAGTGNGQFSSSLSGIATDSVGNVYTAEQGATNRIQRFDTTGAYVNQMAISGGAVDVAFNIDNVMAVALYGTGQIVEYLTDFVSYYATFFVPQTIVRMTSRDGQLCVAAGTDLYFYNINKKFGTTFGLDWYDITDYVDFSAGISLSQTSASGDFTLGEIVYGNVSLKLVNRAGFFDVEYMSGSIWYDTQNTYCRNDSMIKIMDNDKTLFIGTIDGKNCMPENNFMTLSIIHVLKKLDNIETASLGLVSNTSTFTSCITALLTNAGIADYLTYSAANVDIAENDDIVINDISSLPTNGGDLLKSISKLALFNFGTQNGNDFFTYSIVNTIKNATGQIQPNYIITQNELYVEKVYNRGEQRLFGTVLYPAGSFTQITGLLNPKILWLYFDSRSVSIGDDSITTTATRQNIIDRYMKYIDIYPAKEFEIKIPLIELLSDSFFKKVLNINSFSDIFQNYFNVPALPAGNTVLPAAATSLYTRGLRSYVNYYVIGVEHSIGKTTFTKLKLKEIIKQ